MAKIGPIWGRCYDPNFMRFLQIFDEKIGVFLKNQCYDQIFTKSNRSLSKKRHHFRQIFRRKYFENHNIGPWSLCLECQLYLHMYRWTSWSHFRDIPIWSNFPIIGLSFGMSNGWIFFGRCDPDRVFKNFWFRWSSTFIWPRLTFRLVHQESQKCEYQLFLAKTILQTIRVARFFLVQTYQNGKNIQNN
jgi:hypothetical protein